MLKKKPVLELKEKKHSFATFPSEKERTNLQVRREFHASMINFNQTNLETKEHFVAHAIFYFFKYNGTLSHINRTERVKTILIIRGLRIAKESAELLPSRLIHGKVPERVGVLHEKVERHSRNQKQRQEKRVNLPFCTIREKKYLDRYREKDMQAHTCGQQNNQGRERKTFPICGDG